MKYLKTYKIFENLNRSSFYDDMKKIYKEYSEKKDKLRQDYKNSIDDYMLEITDIWGEESFIEDEDPIVWYVLRFKHEDVDKVYNELKMVNNRLKKSLGLEIIVEQIYREFSPHNIFLYTGLKKRDLMFIFNDELLTTLNLTTFPNPLLDEELEEKRLKITIK